MGLYTVLTLLACVLLFCKDVSSSIWSAPLMVKGYESYLDVTPLKYDVSPGTSQIIFTFQTARSHADCVSKTINILVQHGSLPHVDETNLTFPDNFMVDQPTFTRQMKNEQRYVVSVFWPPPGPWFVIAYTERTDKAITQKGLNSKDDCYYYFMSNLETDDTVTSVDIDYSVNHEFTIGNKGMLFRFSIPTSTISFKIQVTKCDPSPCNLTLTYLPYEFSKTVTCDGGAEDCMMYVASPAFMYMQFLEIKCDMVNQSQIVDFSILVTECAAEKLVPCASLRKLDRAQSSRPLSIDFGFLQQSEKIISVDLRLAKFVVIPFDIVDPSDIGGTLHLTMASIQFTSVNDITVLVCGTLLHNYLPDTTRYYDLCTNMTDGIMHNFTLEGKEQPSFYVPYPKVGSWHIMLQATCFYSKNYTKTSCPGIVLLQMYLSIEPCVDSGCSDKGTCMSGSLTSDQVFFSACRCDAKYQGYACTDDTNAQSVSVQLAGAYLLTMSNLFFVPAIVIAVRRRYFVEAFVYLYNMFFSTFYHACDGIRLEKYRMCITKYDVLQVADFFGSACSLWFTIIAMARIRYQYITPVLHVFGAFCLVIGVVYDKTSLYVIVVPIACGLVVIIASWGHKMYKKKKLYPSWRRYLFFLLPGLVLAAIGASVFSFLETEDNYKYVHSVWHMCIALSICLFLPPRRMSEYSKDLDESNTSSQLLTPAVTQSTMVNGEETNSGYINEVP